MTKIFGFDDLNKRFNELQSVAEPSAHIARIACNLLQCANTFFSPSFQGYEEYAGNIRNFFECITIFKLLPSTYESLLKGDKKDACKHFAACIYMACSAVRLGMYFFPRILASQVGNARLLRINACAQCIFFVMSLIIGIEGSSYAPRLVKVLSDSSYLFSNIFKMAHPQKENSLRYAIAWGALAAIADLGALWLHDPFRDVPQQSTDLNLLPCEISTSLEKCAKSLQEQYRNVIASLATIEQDAAVSHLTDLQRNFSTNLEKILGDDCLAQTTKDELRQQQKIVCELVRVFSGQGMWNEVCINDDGVIPAEAKGNCLFISLWRGLCLNNNNFRNEVESVDALRKQIVQWMRENYDRDTSLQKYVGDAMMDIRDRMMKERDERNLVRVMQNCRENNQEEEDRASKMITALGNGDTEVYFSYMKQDKSWGSAAEIYAASQRFQCRIVIERVFNLPSQKIMQRRDLDPPFA